MLLLIVRRYDILVYTAVPRFVDSDCVYLWGLSFRALYLPGDRIRRKLVNSFKSVTWEKKKEKRKRYGVPCGVHVTHQCELFFC